MEAYAIEKYLRLSPSKARLVAELIKGKSVTEARAILKALPHKSTALFEKTLNSAVANGVNNFKMDEDIMYVADVIVNAGEPLKRMLPRGFGRADVIRRPLSAIKVVVKEKEEV
ncbi:MAG: 50S ribosomal protein L22 [Bacteroidales bacterium]|jgi:large subunit ribosomal protein L22|nr:50S ribosomal protein L22 [Bacteroidales bacterium]